MTCKVCTDKCGNGTPTAKGLDPVKLALCGIFCVTRKEFCEGKHKGKKPSSVAKAKAANSSALDRAIARKYGNGAGKALEKMLLVPYKGALAKWGRTPLDAKTLARHLKPLRDKLRNEALATVGKKVAKKAGTAWMKFVPILNVLSTAYDIYDIATTGYDLYKAVDEAMSAYKGDVFRVHPDISIYDSDGKLTDIYDWKFDTDKWQGGQAELYDKALKDAGQNRPGVNPNAEISSATCKCDGPPTASVPTG